MKNFEKLQKKACINGCNSRHWYSHDICNDKAKKLNINSWGKINHVLKIAKMNRKPGSRNEVRKILYEIRDKKFINLYNNKLTATISKNSIGKLLGGNWQIAANIDQLFINGIEPWKFKLDPGKENSGLKERRILFSPMIYEEKIILVKLIIKEYKNPQDGTRIYSGQIIDHDIRKKSGCWSLQVQL